MTVKICAAHDCSNIVKHNGVYCKPKCRYRASKQRTYSLRARQGLCIQCGGEMDSPVSKWRTIVSPKHCSKCQEYFHDRYNKKITKTPAK